MNKITEYGLYLFYILFPFVVFSTFLFGGTSTRSIQLITFTTILGILAALSLFKRNSSYLVSKSPIFIALVVYFGCLFLSALVGLSFKTSFWSVATRTTGLWYFLHLGFFMLLLWSVIKDQAKQKKMIFVIVVTTVLYSVLSFLGPEGLGLIFKNYPNDGFRFGNSTFAGMYIFGAFLLSLYYLFQAETKRWWMYLLPVLLIINPYIISRNVWFGNFSNGIIGESRASASVIVLSLIGLLVIWAISKIKDLKLRSRVSYGLFGLGLIILIVSAVSLLSPDGFFRKAYLSQATAARPLVWEIAQKSIAERPVLGWGSDNFERVFETNYDNRLLQDEFGNEAWFDRAHNIFVDQLIDIGYVGLTVYILVYVVIILSLIYTALNSKERSDQAFASILILYFSLHFLEVQTAFDTSISYGILAFMIVCAVVLFDRTRKAQGKTTELVLTGIPKYILAGVLLIFFVWSTISGLIPYVQAQIANGKVRTVGSAEKRLPYYDELFGSPIDNHVVLWRTVTDFQRGIAANSAVLRDKEKFEALKNEILIFEQEYKEYIKENPTHFRAHLNLADVLIYQMLFEENKLKEAQEVLDQAIELVPQSPQAYWMKAVASIYMKKFNLAREAAQQAVALNPKIKQSQTVVEYVERSIKNFPSIDLFFFTQI